MHKKTDERGPKSKTVEDKTGDALQRPNGSLADPDHHPNANAGDDSGAFQGLDRWNVGSCHAALPSLRTSERKKWLYVVFVGRLEGVDIAVPKISLRHDVCSAPGEFRFVLRPRQHISHEPCMTTVAIGEGMDRN